jgi:hypothetical protein
VNTDPTRNAMWIHIRLLIFRWLRCIAWRTGLVVRETPCIPLSAVLLTSIRYAHVAEEIGDTPVSARLEIGVVGSDAREVVAPWEKVVCVVCELAGGEYCSWVLKYGLYRHRLSTVLAGTGSAWPASKSDQDICAMNFRPLHFAVFQRSSPAGAGGGPAQRLS